MPYRREDTKSINMPLQEAEKRGRRTQQRSGRAAARPKQARFQDAVGTEEGDPDWQAQYQNALYREEDDPDRQFQYQDVPGAEEDRPGWQGQCQYDRDQQQSHNDVWYHSHVVGYLNNVPFPLEVGELVWIVTPGSHPLGVFRIKRAYADDWFELVWWRTNAPHTELVKGQDLVRNEEAERLGFEEVVR